MHTQLQKLSNYIVQIVLLWYRKDLVNIRLTSFENVTLKFNPIFSVCKNGKWVLDPKKAVDCTKKCPPGKVYRENYVLCGMTCQTHNFPFLCEYQEPLTGCTCPEGKVLNDQVSNSKTVFDCY